MTVRRPLPGSLVGRTVLVLVLGLVLSQIASVIFFSLNRQEMATLLGRRQIVERVSADVQLMEATPAEERRRVLGAVNAGGVRVRNSPAPWVETDDATGEAAWVRNELQSRFSSSSVHAAMDTLPPLPFPPDGRGMDNRPPPRGFPDRPFPPGIDGLPPEGDLPLEPPEFDPGDPYHPHGPRPFMRISIQLKDASWLNFAVSERFGDSLRPLGYLLPLVAGFLVVTALSVLAVRRATRPLAVLAAAAERLGRDVGSPPVPLEGPSEVRAAALAFNEMQTRLKRFIDDRTQMIAAISHDLRTPITRLKLRAEFVDDEEQQQKMLADLDEMEAMIAQTLAFGRDDAAREPRCAIDLAEMLTELCRQFGARYEGPQRLVLSVGPLAVKRAFANLLDNARKYGGGSILLCASQGGHLVTVTIEDNGAGIPEADLERVFRPFVRVEGSRNRDTGGTGLGLAVARSNIRAHGGDIVIENRPQGGVRVTVTLPR